MGKQTRHLRDEVDIGSGEKTPGEHDTEKLIEEVGKDKKNADRQMDMKQKHDAVNKQNSTPLENH